MPFNLSTNAEGDVAYGVLTQYWCDYWKPVAYLSKLLDPMVRGWPQCLQVVATTVTLIEESRKLALGKPKLHTPHDLKTQLTRKVGWWSSDSQLLAYELVLLNEDQIEIATTNIRNPAQFLSGILDEEIEHTCLQAVDLQTREVLQEIPLLVGKILFVDGLSGVVEGKRRSGYAMVDRENLQVLEKAKPPPYWSAWMCELFTLKRGLEVLKGDLGTIYTDSKYAFEVAHTFGKIWTERGFLDSKGKGLAHEKMV